MLVIATGNMNKMREFQRILPSFKMMSMKEAGVLEEIAETGKTFAENALIKARAVCRMTGKPAIADDSGLCVDALSGAPGIFSARYAGENATNEARIEKLLHALDGVEDEQRGAAFVCVIAYVTPDGTEEIFTGECRGIITRAPRGEGGFGYDPVFFVQTEGLTFGEMDAATKDLYSHRAKALLKLKNYLEA